jgi:enoyl-CoA hydratase
MLRCVQTACADVGVLELARPERLNAFGTELWANFGAAVQALASAEPVRAVLLCGQGPHFCAGIDTAYLAQMMQQLSEGTSCEGRVRERLRSNILALQQVNQGLVPCLDVTPLFSQHACHYCQSSCTCISLSSSNICMLVCCSVSPL